MARLLVDTGALFQHIPRTGGTFVEEAISTLGIKNNRWARKQPDHLPRKHSLFFHYHHKHKLRVKFLFTFVRHPVPYYASVWRYLVGAQQREELPVFGYRWTWHPFKVPASLFSPDFDTWVERMVNAEPMWATRLVEWYCGPRDGEFCEYIGRTEDLIPNLIEVLGKLGYDVEGKQQCLEELGLINVGDVERPTVTDRSKDKILKSEALLIDRFYGQQTRHIYWY